MARSRSAFGTCSGQFPTPVEQRSSIIDGTANPDNVGVVIVRPAPADGCLPPVHELSEITRNTPPRAADVHTTNAVGVERQPLHTRP